MAADDPITKPQAGVRQLRFVRPPGATSVLLVRHGESVEAVEGDPFPLVDGHGDPELAELGRRQAELVAERLSALDGADAVAAIYVTNLRRTAQTAEPLATRLGLEPVVEPRLREVYLGEWEAGLYRIRMLEQGPIVRRMLEEERWDLIPGAESDESLRGRVTAAMRDIAARHPDQTVAVFTHGGVIGRLLAEAARSRLFAFLGADNASINHLVVTGERWVIRSYNDTAHLAQGDKRRQPGGSSRPRT